MPESRLSVRKTYKLYVGGAFPRSESGRTYLVDGDNVALASRKDARDAVVAARKAFKTKRPEVWERRARRLPLYQGT